MGRSACFTFYSRLSSECFQSPWNPSNQALFLSHSSSWGKSWIGFRASEPCRNTRAHRSLLLPRISAYVATCLWFAYVEGYKGFQLKFAPLVVKRSFTLVPGKNGTQWYHFLLAPAYSMGMLNATRKRKIVSFSVTLGVAAIVAGVKRLSYPWRNIIDAGVVAGLSWGSLSLALFYVKSWITGQPPSQVDAALPEPKKP